MVPVYSFAAYMAASALLRRVAISVPSFGYRATPMLPVIKKSRPETLNPCVRAWRIFWEKRATESAESTSSKMIVNSSPLRRATVSLARATLLSRIATDLSNSSPATWPSRSLTILNRSRSRNRSATNRLARCARWSALFRSSMKNWRLGNPVSKSYRAN